MIGGAALNTGIGMVTGAINDKRQLNQNQKLLDQQAAADRKQAAFNQALGMQTWEQTGPVAMTRELKEAGLSPALQYGGSGGGGQTMGNPGGNVNAAKPPTGGGEIIGLSMMDAQRKLIEAQTEKTKVETAKTAGVDTELTAAQGRLAKNVAQFYVDTYEENYSKVKAELNILENESKTASETQIVDVEAKKAELVGLGIANELKQAQKDLTKAQMEATTEMVKQKWQEVNIKQGHLDLDKFIQDVKESTKLTTQAIIRVIGLLR